jgi:hypothetical protein
LCYDIDVKPTVRLQTVIGGQNEETNYYK